MQFAPSVLMRLCGGVQLARQLSAAATLEEKLLLLFLKEPELIPR